MSSFFTAPPSQRKRKRTEASSSKPRKRIGLDRDAHPDTDRPERGTARQRRKREHRQDRDEDISGSEDSDLSDGNSEAGSVEDESEASSAEDETVGERRARLAQRYLDDIREEVGAGGGAGGEEEGFDAADLDNDLIAKRLREDVDEARGRQFRLIANKLDWKRAKGVAFRADTLSTTGVAVGGERGVVYVVSKDRCLVKWKLQTPKERRREEEEEEEEDLNGREERNGKEGTKKKGQFPGKTRPVQVAFAKGISTSISTAGTSTQHGHVAPILCVAASPDGKYVATGGADNRLIIWSADALKPLKTFLNHRDSVLGLAFAPSTSSQQGYGAQLFSASADRSIKTYNLAGEESLAYVETLFGHQDHVCAVAAMGIDQCVTVGSRDRSARLWKVIDETQLKFLGDSSAKEKYQAGSLDVVAALPPAHFVTGDDAGCIKLWNMHKKKALYTMEAAHGVDERVDLEEVTSETDPRIIEELKRVDGRREQARGVTALASLPGTDVVVSGSWDGRIRVWKVSEDKRILVPLGVVGTVKDAGEVTMTNGEHVNGIDEVYEDQMNGVSGINRERGPIRGVINSIAVFERRKELKDAFGIKREGETQGLCIVVGTGKETRLGRFAPPVPGKGRNGAMVFEVPLLPSSI